MIEGRLPERSVGKEHTWQSAGCACAWARAMQPHYAPASVKIGGLVYATAIFAQVWMM